MSFLRKHYPLFVLLVLALATRFLFLWYPAEVVFDEVHFGKFVSAYFTHQYYFDIHPPLGKLLVAGFAKVADIQPDASFEKIGEAVSSKELFALRFLPALLGSLLVLLVYQLVLALGGSRRTAFLAGWLVLFDNAFLVESKFLLVDSFLFFFGFLSIWLFLLARRQTLFIRQMLLLTLAALGAGLAFSVKWTGLSFLGIILVFGLVDFLRKPGLKDLGNLALKCLVLFLVSFSVYVLFFAVHFRLLSRSGPGDAFMSVDFQKTLEGSQLGAGQPLPFWGKFIELNKAMFFYNSTLKKDHPDGSTWYEWPLARKPVWYWSKNVGQAQGNIYLMGNPLVWWLAGLGILASLFSFKKKRWIVFFLLFGYLANLLPFILVSRVAFVYHYLPALVFAILLLAWWLDRFPKGVFVGCLFLSFLCFLAISPLSYGFILQDNVNRVYQDLMSFFH